MLSITSYSIEDTKLFAKKVLDELLSDYNANTKNISSSKNKATILILRGDLGSGKTTFTKCLGSILGIGDEITSPTFAIEKKYKISKEKTEDGLIIPFKKLIHIDAFRLESAKEIMTIDFLKTLETPENLICFEWPEMVADLDVLPKESPIIEFEFVDENTRKMFFSPNPNYI